MEHVTPRHLTNGNTEGDRIFCAVRADSYVTNNRTFGSGFFLFGPLRRRPVWTGSVEAEAEESTELGAANQ
jgi:hypothetical protein